MFLSNLCHANIITTQRAIQEQNASIFAIKRSLKVCVCLNFIVSVKSCSFSFWGTKSYTCSKHQHTAYANCSITWSFFVFMLETMIATQRQMKYHVSVIFIQTIWFIYSTHCINYIVATLWLCVFEFTL